MRIFLALPLWQTLDTAAWKQLLGSDRIRWVPAHQLHLTLRFKGEITEEHLPSVSVGLRNTARRFPPFSLRWDRTGVFPNWRDPRVLWVGIQQPGAERICQIAAHLGNASITPHVTVGRVKRRLTRETLCRWKTVKPPDGDVHVKDICLVRSVLTPQGPVYTILESADLEGAITNE